MNNNEYFLIDLPILLIRILNYLTISVIILSVVIIINCTKKDKKVETNSKTVNKSEMKNPDEKNESKLNQISPSKSDEVKKQESIQKNSNNNNNNNNNDVKNDVKNENTNTKIDKKDSVSGNQQQPPQPSVDKVQNNEKIKEKKKEEKQMKKEKIVGKASGKKMRERTRTQTQTQTESKDQTESKESKETSVYSNAKDDNDSFNEHKPIKREAKRANEIRKKGPVSVSNQEYKTLRPDLPSSDFDKSLDLPVKPKENDQKKIKDNKKEDNEKSKSQKSKIKSSKSKAGDVVDK